MSNSCTFTCKAFFLAAVQTSITLTEDKGLKFQNLKNNSLL